ncbi:hypothetical protein I3843_08G160600 [Carya illinoinensis]|nr:hypothetical protein I3843_08G160600 [Carya illinoinensis]
MSYFCITCSFIVHTQCALIPSTLKVTSHNHHLSLNLKYSPQLHQSENQQICQLCARKVDIKYKAYYCSSCDFAAHPRCAAKIDTRDETFDPELKDDQPIETHLLGPDELTTTLAQIVNKINLGNGKAEIVTKIKHIWHEHRLKLGVELENNEKCDGFCNGLVYNCDDCRFQLDVPCSLIPTKFTHEGHEHPLFLLSTSEVRGICTSCGESRRLLIRCTDCEFSMDMKCATLPLTTKYGHYEQPFILSYTVKDHDSTGYYCDICEKKRDPKHWFYYCADLQFAAHPNCILGKWPLIKFGCTYTFDVHKHSLTFVERTKYHPNCRACGGSYNSLIFVCAQCDHFALDPNCLWKMINKK